MTSTEGERPGPDLLAELREHTRRLAEDLSGPLRRVRVRSGETTIEVEWQPEAVAAATPVSAAPAQPPASEPPDPAPSTETADDGYAVVDSPMVGTFYRAPGPDRPPFVEVGDRLAVDQTIGVIEAMKLFNPIGSELAGVVVEVLVPDAAPVEFGQPLLRIALERAAEPVAAGRG
ncbi:acetyl-CoA carboxylase biotin carboxyl carrier protein [Actinokineospora enzanensis]|uniref:acetyl-CoA carboxylase biotin carboxyl carrier protein n=1 Tax=Actinokineospora enzanensis TaxID=155975 RepID=UPI000378B926|nr:acetyl-CoA carboxylase biotin carboxyl carrier protein [Actinokineospora enzanensis]